MKMPKLKLMIFPKSWIAAILILISAPAILTAQEQRVEGFAKTLTRAEAYLSRGQYENGIILLEKLRLRQPHDPKLLRLLERGYRRTKRYSDLLDLVADRLPTSKDHLADMTTIADCQFKLGQLAEAESTLTKLLTPPPEEPRAYLQVARAYQRNGRYQQAVRMYELARENTGDSTLFSRELADLYEAKREYAKAIREYYLDIQLNPRNLQGVRRKIAAIARMEEGIVELTAALEQIVDENPDNFHARRMYAELLLESRDPQAAWEQYLAAEELAPDPKENVLYFIGRCLEQDWPEMARRACLFFFDRYPEHTATVDVQLFHARALIAGGFADTALTILTKVAALFDRNERQAELYTQIGDVYLDSRPNLDSAEHFYRLALNVGSRQDNRLKAALRLGDCRVRRGDLDGADSAYAVSGELRLSPTQAEKVMFKRAELLFFSQQFDSLSTVLKVLLEKYPKGFFINDAIILSLRVSENREPFDWSLKKFSIAALNRRQNRLDSATTYYWQLAADSTNGLADDALLELGRSYAQAGQPDSSVLAYQYLTDRYPKGFLTPAALTEQGVVYATLLGQPEKAGLAFRRVLADYPHSPYLEEARRRLRELGQRPELEN